MSLFASFEISASGLTANRFWAETIANNVANMNSTGTPGDPARQPYQRQAPVFAEIMQQQMNSGRGVQVNRLVKDQNEPRQVHDPSHPDADPVTGNVAYPNINVLNEMVNLIAATRAYEANVTTFEAAKGMALSALEMGR